MKTTHLFLAVFLTAVTTAFSANPLTPPESHDLLKTLKSGHPRLMIDARTPDRIRALVKADPIAAKIYQDIQKDAGKILTQVPSKYSIPDGKRLLSVSRRVKDRMEILGLLYRMTGERKYADRAWKEIEAAAAFKDWNPRHFLDTAEMTYGFAIGLDWMYDAWAPAQRKILEDTIVKLGLLEALKVYRKGTWWVSNHNNWNQVCNGGIGMGALAIADRQPDLCREILSASLRSLPRAMGHYAPDGGGTEGPTYWSYGTRYNLIFLDGLRSALGTDFGLTGARGFKESGDYHLYQSGAGRITFNFADCGETLASTPQHFWMARAFNTPHYSWHRMEALRRNPGKGTVLDLLWWDDQGRDFDPESIPLDKHFRGAEVMSLRSSWTDPNALVLAIQAGDNENLGGHRHLDLGSFILEALGERWIIDSGTDHETYMTHRNKQKRWAFYRVRAEGHNTLVINPAYEPDQEPKAVAPVKSFQSGEQEGSVVIDLTAAYKKHAKQVKRTFLLKNRKELLLRDIIKTEKPIDLWWFAHTTAEVKLSSDKRTATLLIKDKQLDVQLVTPEQAVLEVMDAVPLPSSPDPKVQADNKGRRKLAIHLPKARDTAINVRFIPVQR